MSDITSVAAIIISLVSAFISVLTYFQNSARYQLRLLQVERMRTVASRTVILWDQIYTILSGKSSNFHVDDYLLPSIQNNARRLEEALDLAISAGLMTEFISTRANALALHVVFLQSLYYISTPLPSEKLFEACCDDHLTLGMVRLLNQCVNFRENILSQEIKKSTKDYVGSRIELAWNYLPEHD